MVVRNPLARLRSSVRRGAKVAAGALALTTAALGGGWWGLRSQPTRT
jgi:hypothetical protein